MPITVPIHDGNTVPPECPPASTECVANCEWVFSRLRISPLVAGGTIVEWELHPNFRDTPPHTFQLQSGETGLASADDWTDVGSPVVNAFSAVDPNPLPPGRWRTRHYRVKLTTMLGTYYSAPQYAANPLSRTEWLQAKEIMRLELLRLKDEPGTEGYLLKRKLSGDPCECLDPLTQESTNPDCELCYGAGFVGGYYAPYPCVWVELGRTSHRTHLDDNRGTADDLPVLSGCRMLNVPQVTSYDVWVDKRSDHRWIIHRVDAAAEIRGVPIVVSCELRLAPYSHPVYNVIIPNQNA